MGRMSKRKDELNHPFDDSPRNKSTGNSSPEMTNEYLTGALLGLDLPGLEQDANQKPPRIELISIDDIVPDRSQPRRVIPHSVRAGRLVSAANLPIIFDRWLAAVNETREDNITEEAIVLYLKGRETEADSKATQEIQEVADVTVDDNGEENPVERSFVQLVELAASIRDKGLMNPITVAPQNGGYVIETGERRWAAYHLLKYYIGVDDEHKERGTLKWDKIPAVDVGAMDVWRQAYENNARNNLNAIGKARQLAILLMRLLEDEGAATFQRFDAFDHEQEFYAQVADGNTYRIPYGKGKKIITALNFKSTKQIRDYRRLLKVPREVWDRADEEDWAEGTIRSQTTVPDGTHLTLPDASRIKTTVPTGTHVDEDDDPMPDKIAKLRDYYSPKKLKRMSIAERQDVIDSLSAVLSQLKKLDKKLAKEETSGDE